MLRPVLLSASVAVRRARSISVQRNPSASLLRQPGDGLMTGFPHFWARVVKLGGLPADITPHVARHSFASLAGDIGYSEPTIAALIGHRGQTITSRYVHAADAVLLAAADAVASRTAELMGEGQPKGDVVPLRVAG
jgi:integrase